MQRRRITFPDQLSGPAEVDPSQAPEVIAKPWGILRLYYWRGRSYPETRRGPLRQ